MPDDRRPPYRGLLAFERDDADLFGGREAATQKVLDLLDHHPIMAVIGASGSGKSSVVKAGVIAHLRERRDPSWRVLTLRPGGDPLLALARALGSELDRDANETIRIERARERGKAFFERRHRSPTISIGSLIANGEGRAAASPRLRRSMGGALHSSRGRQTSKGVP